MENSKSDLSSEISPAVIQILEQYLNVKYNHRKYKYEIQKATKKGDNYVGIVYRVGITLINRNNQHQSIILKVPPQNIQQRNQFFARAGFLRESCAYEEFLPLVKHFQKSKDLKANDTFFEYPQCYFTSTDNFNETICMNDLQMEGFFMHNRFEPLEFAQVAHVICVYAKLHATSLAIKDQVPHKLMGLQNMSDIFEQRKDDAQLNYYFESLKQSALQTVDNENDQAYSEKLKKYFDSDTFYNLMLKLLDSKTSEPYSVICHGDCWINNIMFKQEKGKLVDVRLIDWQIMRYSSPITDIMYFLMTSTNRVFRQKHLKEIFNIYHGAARQHITRLGSDAEKLYPRRAFDKEFKEKGTIGLLFSMIILPMLTTKNEDVPDLEQLSEKVSAGHSTDAVDAGFVGATSTLYNERMREIILDSIDWNLI